MKKKLLIIPFLLLLAGCEYLNMINCKYKLDNVTNPTWAGINFAGIHNMSDLSIADLANVASAIYNQDYNLKFDLNVLARNETDNPASITGFDYIFLLDEEEFTRGENSTGKITVSPNGGQTTIPIMMNLNIKDFVTGKSNIENLINLVLNITNYGEGKESNVKVQISPWIPVNNEIQKMPYITLNKSFQ